MSTRNAYFPNYRLFNIFSPGSVAVPDPLTLSLIPMEAYVGIDTDVGFSDPVVLAMNSMRPEFLEVVLMCDVEEMSYLEAAARADCPVGTVMSRLHRGRRALKDKLVSRSHLDAV